jgi:hypothetical protein
MSADRQNATLYAGDDLVLVVTVSDEIGNRLAIGDCSFAWILAASAGSSAVISKSSSSPAEIQRTHPNSGGLSIYVTHEDTTGLSGAMWHQLVMTDGGGNISTITTGNLTFNTRT